MRMEKLALIVVMVAASSVLVCWAIDWGVIMLPIIAQELGKLHQDAVRLTLIVGTAVLWREAGGDVEAGGSSPFWLYRGERNRLDRPGVNLSWSSTTLSSPSNSDAGCLRRRAAAKLFFKVFDPGGQNVPAAAAAAAAAAVFVDGSSSSGSSTAAATKASTTQQQQRQQQRGLFYLL